MQVQAQSVKPGDFVRGIGLVVEFSEPQSDFTTSLSGHYVLNRETGEQWSAQPIVLPNEHLVNVRRPFAVGDAVTIPAGYTNLVDVLDFLSTFEVAALSEGFVDAKVVAVLPEERQVVVERDGVNYAVPFRSARHALDVA